MGVGSGAPAITADSRPRKSSQVINQRASGSLVLLDLERGEYYALEEVGARVWNLCDGSHMVSDVVSIICQEYEAARDKVEADVLELLTDLADANLVETTS
jgi:Coenzyme PQQ synthesis protein D (PqqD)